MAMDIMNSFHIAVIRSWESLVTAYKPCSRIDRIDRLLKRSFKLRAPSQGKSGRIHV